MRVIAACVGACLAMLAGAVGPATAQTVPKAQRSLQRTLTRDLASAGGRHGALVVDLATGTTLYASAPTVPRLPASVEKLYTTTTALATFGPDATLTTGIYGVGSLDTAGAWHGTLYLRGGGDPTFGSVRFDNAFYGTGVGATVQRLVANLARAGIRRVAGRIVGDETYLDSLRGTPASGYGPDLEVEGELSALAYDDGFLSTAANALQPRPALYATQQFTGALRAGGIRVPKGTHVYTGPTPPGARLLAAVHSPRMATLIRLTNAPSDNFFAELLLKDIGARFGTGGTTAAGTAVVRSLIAQRYGLHPRLDDGSGLSRYDRTSPAEIVSLLRRQASTPEFVDSLAVAGVSGTMADEMLGTRAVGNCRGKTGTLSDVANLVGYCTARNGDTIAFAFLVSNQTNTYWGHLMEDRMGVALANYNGPSSASSARSPASSSTGTSSRSA
jgi:D-alanyl-D-alanine carboxypeptidase/D-alanyl-D-alanine-endopeptidase (penicillin-binding protein 4)